MSKVDDYLAAVSVVDGLRIVLILRNREIAFVDNAGNLVITLPDNSLTRVEALALGQFIFDNFR